MLTEYAKYPYSYGKIDRQLVFDREHDHYLLMSVGWDKSRVHGCVIHIDLIDGKYWIRATGPRAGSPIDLEAAGIPKDRIVLAFKPPEIRPITGYAVALARVPGLHSTCTDHMAEGPRRRRPLF